MKKTVLKFGLASGSIQAAMTLVTLPLYRTGTLDFDTGEVIGYSSMVLSFLLVFFGIRSYRDEVGGGSITFGRAMKVGLLITLVTCAMYVTTWEIYYFNFDRGFVQQYTQHTLARKAAKGATAAELAAEKEKMAKFQEMYQNPLLNTAITFMEIFPLGLVMTAISAAILRRKPDQGRGAPAAVAPVIPSRRSAEGA